MGARGSVRRNLEKEFERHPEVPRCNGPIVRPKVDASI
jgi:hypothetical protein